MSVFLETDNALHLLVDVECLSVVVALIVGVGCAHEEQFYGWFHVDVTGFGQTFTHGGDVVGSDETGGVESRVGDALPIA